MLKSFPIIALSFILFSCGKSQSSQNFRPYLIGSCEGCEAIFEYGDKILNYIDTLPDYRKDGEKIIFRGRVFQHDGLSPAPGVILYIYHTNQDGIYEARAGAQGWELRHGWIRGWTKTDSLGQYEFHSLKPGTYPDNSEPAHIHLTILQADGGYYWLDGLYFQGDPLLKDVELHPTNPRGGSVGVFRYADNLKTWLCERNIILEKNIK